MDNTKSKFKKGDVVYYTPKLSGFDNKTPLVISNVTVETHNLSGDKLELPMYLYSFEGQYLCAYEHQITNKNKIMNKKVIFNVPLNFEVGVPFDLPEKDSWSFVEMFFPNYQTSKDITRSDDLECHINGEKELQGTTKASAELELKVLNDYIFNVANAVYNELLDSEQITIIE